MWRKSPDPDWHPQKIDAMQKRSGPVSRVLSWTIISLGRRLLDGSSNLPGRGTRRTASRRQPVARLVNYALLGLASGGVYRAEPVTRSAGALLPHRFTLTSSRSLESGRDDRRFTFCGTVPVLTNGGRYPPPCPVKPGLSSMTGINSPHSDRLAHFAMSTVRESAGWQQPTDHRRLMRAVSRIAFSPNVPIRRSSTLR